jgi:hypothetical protein
MRRLILALGLTIGAATVGASAWQSEPGEYLHWTSERALQVGRAMRGDGRVGGALDLRVLRTERSYNYKLRATWMTPDVIRATARLTQLSQRLTDEETIALVREAEAAGDLIVLMEIDPREGSGVVPLDVVVLMQPKGARDDDERTIRGRIAPALRNTRALAGVFRRDYAYEQFWVVFPLDEARRAAIFAPSLTEVEFLVRIYDKEGRVSWPIPASVRGR